MPEGILVINKEPGYTSQDVVSKLRGILHMKRIGHTGTLDPAAEGVLPVCLGSATKACQYLTDHDKEYKACLQLGITTDTQDLTGKVLSQSDPSKITREQIEAAVKQFTGDILQVPPMYSALKVNGVRLYEMARKGRTVERKPRQIHIESIVIEKIELPYVDLNVRCSKGTYIRTLCEDIGKALGVGGAMAHLQRTRVGRFSLQDALTLAEVEKAKEAGNLEDHILPVDQVFPYEHVCVKPESVRFLVNGNALEAEDFKEEPGSSPVLVYSPENVFVAIYRKKDGRYTCQTMFGRMQEGERKGCRS